MNTHRDIIITHTPYKEHQFEIIKFLEDDKKTISYLNFLGNDRFLLGTLTPCVKCFFKTYAVDGECITICKDYDTFPNNGKPLYKVTIGLPPCTMDLCLEVIKTEPLN